MGWDAAICTSLDDYAEMFYITQPWVVFFLVSLDGTDKASGQESVSRQKAYIRTRLSTVALDFFRPDR